MNSAGNREIEIKLRVEDLGAVKRRLTRLRALRSGDGRVHEMNLLFDTPQGGLAKHGQLLRLRVETAGHKKRKAGGNPAVLTYKGPAEAAGAAVASPATSASSVQTLEGRRGRYKVREELEVGVGDSDGMRAVLEALGLRGWFRYEKYRTTFRLPESLRWAAGLHIVLDETPIGDFIELEGPPAAIDQAARLMGYAPADYITRSYLALHLEHCRKRGLPTQDMLFPSREK